MRKVEREIVSEAQPKQDSGFDLQQMFSQLQANPEALGQLAALLKNT